MSGLGLLRALALALGAGAAVEAHGADEADPSIGLIQFGAAALQAARTPKTAMRLQLMPDRGLKGMGAVCLDGSDAGFYFAPASSAANTNDWQIYFQGGGWCYDEIDCWDRSKTHLGSSANLPQVSSMGGIMSDDCQVNPDFCNFNRVHLVYCDGNSFSGNRDEPLVVRGLDGKDKPLYFRGKRIIDAVLQTLLTMGLDRAENVLLTGCSAGGLATFLHTDYVHGVLKTVSPSLKKFRSAPISGFFLHHSTVEGLPVYGLEMASIFKLANSTHGVNERCSAAMSEHMKWTCNFAEMAYKYTESPIFPLNSALDSWQTMCIFTSRLEPGFPNQTTKGNGVCGAAPGWGDCARNVEKCNETQLVKMNAYIDDFQATINGIPQTFLREGNGAFIHSCHQHCEAQSSPQWNNMAVDGVTMQQAFSKWWNSDAEAASRHTYRPCRYRGGSPHQCNPTCSDTQPLAQETIAV